MLTLTLIYKNGLGTKLDDLWLGQEYVTPNCITDI